MSKGVPTAMSVGVAPDVASSIGQDANHVVNPNFSQQPIHDRHSSSAFSPKIDTHRRQRGFCEKFFFQIKLLLHKRYLELTNKKMDIFYLTFPPLLFFSLAILLYAVIPIFFPDGVEEFLIPIGFWIFVQKVVVTVMYEKHHKLLEAMRMMGLMDSSYWVSYFISEGVIIGFINSILCACFSTYGLFNHANFGVVFLFLYFFFLSVVPFCFFISSFYDTPQTSGQATLLVLLGFFVIYIALNLTYKPVGAQAIACLFPPLALQLACCAFRKSYTGLSIGGIIGIMFLDIFLYSFLAWYFSQVWHSKVGVAKPFYFIFQPSYWFGESNRNGSQRATSFTAPPAVSTDANGLRIALVESVDKRSGDAVFTANDAVNVEEAVHAKPVPIEPVPETLFGKPTVSLNRLRKTFGQQIAVNDLSFKMYENQIFALLGHNGAGKTTTINMLTGLMAPDVAAEGGAAIYGNDLYAHMDNIRQSMGVCPQHDVLFDNLSVKDTIMFFSQLKGFTYDEAVKEATSLPQLFHLSGRLDHTGSELSGGQKRKLSVAIAVCGGSRFIVLDEPTAGMDPLARRELWDLLAILRKGRTILLTTHYMDEADVLGDRIGIMSLGQLQCLGSSQFLKTTFGAGYKLIFDKGSDFSNDHLAALTNFVMSNVPKAKFMEMDGAENQVTYELPFDSVSYFGPFFTILESDMHKFNVWNFGVTITSLEDVFLKVGEDHSVKPKPESGSGIGNSNQFEANLTRQVLGMVRRKLDYARKDFVTIPLLGLPICVAIITAVLYRGEYISSEASTNDLIMSGIYIGGYLGAPGLIAEFIVRERQEKLRNLLTVMGCDYKAYWIGTFIADMILMSIPLLAIFIAWAPGHMYDFSAGNGGACFFLFILFTAHFISFAYLCSFMFTNPKYCIAVMPFFVIFLILLPSLSILLFTLIFVIGLQVTTFPVSNIAGVVLWGIMILSPHGALYSSLLDATFNYSSFISSFPPLSACIVFMIFETIAFLLLTYYYDSLSIAKLEPTTDPMFNEMCLQNLDDDVQAERNAILSTVPTYNTISGTSSVPPVVPLPDSLPRQALRIERLRKVFPPKKKNGPAVVAAEDVCFGVYAGEIFGLLGANGAGKTTTLSMLTRHLAPTSGNATISDISILSNFSLAARQLGVVTQNNSLWDLLTVEDHLFLFARLRGVPTASVRSVVDATIDQLELTPHRHKQAFSLSGGMKRKLCVAIALIGDPQVVLLDEPSAGLDPVSRRNLWSVILRTMSHRAVVLTTHSMEEAEALCHRIGIMVKGQLRALGTKQHLKNKFGSGYELTVKIKTTGEKAVLAHETKRMTDFVVGLFSAAKLIAENGGLLTYQIPKDQMRMGIAFTEMEKHKLEYNVEDYSVAQPTLEQVFIRTVIAHSMDPNEASNPLQRDSMSTAAVLGGRIQLDENGELVGSAQDANLHDNDQIMEFKAEVNICGCTKFVVQVCMAVFVAFTFLFLGLSFGLRSPICFGLGVICLVVSIVFANIYCCPCCQNSKGVDE